MRKSLQQFAEFIYFFFQNLADFEKWLKMLTNVLLDARICEDFAKFDKILTRFYDSEVGPEPRGAQRGRGHPLPLGQGRGRARAPERPPAP